MLWSVLIAKNMGEGETQTMLSGRLQAGKEDRV